MNTAIVIPARNESATIRAVAQRARAQCPHVIVIDDGSTDGTRDALHDLPVTVLRHAQSAGKGASLLDGIREAIRSGADRIVTLDGDGQHAPEEIPRLLAAAERQLDKIVIGARLRNREAVPWLRNFANHFADFWISWACGARIRDSQSGFRVYPAVLFNDLAIDTNPERGFVFESEILIRAAARGIGVTGVAIDAIYQTSTRPSFYRNLDTWRITRMVAWSLITRGLYLTGLYRAFSRPDLSSSDGDPTADKRQRLV
jgi:glycosyltransferase involved in cell wall biosynthesis